MKLFQQNKYNTIFLTEDTGKYFQQYIGDNFQLIFFYCKNVYIVTGQVCYLAFSKILHLAFHTGLSHVRFS